jgi:hypothetical protein
MHLMRSEVAAAKSFLIYSDGIQNNRGALLTFMWSEFMVGTRVQRNFKMKELK